MLSPNFPLGLGQTKNDGSLKSLNSINQKNLSFCPMRHPTCFEKDLLKFLLD